MKFEKMHGLGNDFVILAYEDIKEIDDLPGFSRKVCDRHLGVGADGILIYSFTTDGLPKMSLWNSDGSAGEMCGNGIRCLARYLFERRFVSNPSFTIMTDAGGKEVAIDEKSGWVEVNMGLPTFKTSEIPALHESRYFIEEKFSVDDREWRATCVNVGNPHCVIFVDSYDEIELTRHGRSIENSPVFPEKINVEFVKIEGPHRMEMRVWERGAGITQACGTGACASFAAACKTGRADDFAEVILPGGILEISFRPDGAILMNGNAEFVYTGSYSV